MARPYIFAFKAGATSVNNYITSDQLIYCGNHFIGRPDGYQTASDSVFVVSLLKSAGRVQINSGSNSKGYDAPAGPRGYTVPMGIGKQSFSLSRNSQTVLSGTSLKDIINGCVCGLWNFNAYVGALPPALDDRLGPEAYGAFSAGLKASCSATPSLGMNPPAQTTSSPTTTTSRTTLTTTTRAPTTTTPSASATPSQACIAGSGENGYIGLCSFCCHYDYCPPGPCTCTSRGGAVQPPPSTGTKGVPRDGLDQSYAGLCSYACDHGYCPDTACKVVN